MVKSSKVLFIHIPKTAGTSLRGFLEGFYNESRAFRGWFINSLLKVPPWGLHDLDFIAGHYPASVCEILPSDGYSVVTFLRDPIARTISHFNHIRTESEALLHPIAKDCELAEFLDTPDGVVELANMQTRFLGAFDIESEYFTNRVSTTMQEAGEWVNGPRIEKAYRKALIFLEKCEVVGVVEHMLESMLLLADKLVLSSQATMGHANRGKLQPPLCSDATLDRLRELNRFDLSLYAEANRILSERIATLTHEQVEESYRTSFESLQPLRRWHYTPEMAANTYGWHGREKLSNGEWARWTAVRNAYIDIPRLLPYASYRITFRAGFFTLHQMETFVFSVNGVKMNLQSVRCDDRSDVQRIYRCTVGREVVDKCHGFIRLGWGVDALVNPKQSVGDTDSRDLGVYLWWCGVENENASFR